MTQPHDNNITPPPSPFGCRSGEAGSALYGVGLRGDIVMQQAVQRIKHWAPSSGIRVGTDMSKELEQEREDVQQEARLMKEEGEASREDSDNERKDLSDSDDGDDGRPGVTL